MMTPSSGSTEASPSPVFSAAQSAGATPIKVVRSAPSDVLFQRLVRQVELATVENEAIGDMLKSLTTIICEQTECLAVWVAKADDKGRFSEVLPLTDENAKPLWAALGQTANEILAHAQNSRQICSTPDKTNPHTQLVAAPVSTSLEKEDQLELILLGCFNNQNHSVLRLQWLMGIASLGMSIWYERRKSVHAGATARLLTDSLGISKALDESTNRVEAAIAIVNQVRRITRADQVAITLNESLIAISDVEQVDRNSEANQSLEKATNHLSDLGEPVVFVSSRGESVSPGNVLAEYCHESRSACCATFPIKNQAGETIGGLLVSGSEAIAADSELDYVSKLTQLIGSHLDVVLRANRSLKRTLLKKLSSMLREKWLKVVGAVILATSLLLAVPMPYRVACNCEVQPVVRRFVSAPYEGVLEKSLVVAGEIVEQDQVLAEMDGRSLRIELAGLEADLGGAAKRRDSALAQGDIAKSQIARSEMSRLSSQIELIHQRTRNLSIRSPISGIVVSGDLEKVQGAPLEVGQTLFEVAPLNEMISEVAIPESEISYVKPGMDVTIKLSAYPFKTWTGKIKRIHPSTEIVQDESVFIAEVSLPNDGVELKPGMKGSAKVKTEWAPLGWNLFHRPWEAVRHWTIW